MQKPAISIRNVSKEFSLGNAYQHNTLRDLIAESPKEIFDKLIKKRKIKRFWALDNINLNIKEGEVIGVIGRNGAGKSTLLKILARIVSPTKGTVTVRGRIATMLEVGTGFHTELTGRENIYLNGAILGMSRREIEDKFSAIVQFSEIGKFLDIPVKRYSSGMQVRLAFSVAAHLDPEILLLDEVLAVGDLSFQRKSLKKMQEIAKKEGTTVVFVSHNLTAVDFLCDRVALIEEGRLVAVGKPKNIISKYMSNYVPSEDIERNIKDKPRTGTGKIRVTDFWIEGGDKKKTSFIKSGDKIRFVFKYICPSGVGQKDVDFGFALRNDMDQPLFLSYLSFNDKQLSFCKPGGKFIFEFSKFPLTKGRYKIGFRATVGEKEADYMMDGGIINVEHGDFYSTGKPPNQTHSPMYVEGDWDNAS